MGKVLRVNLTNKTFQIEVLEAEKARQLMGGAGFVLEYMFNEIPPGIDALAPENKLIFAPGPLAGTSTPCASRIAVGAKSPLTNAAGVAYSGGFFPVEMKFAGYDVLIIEGKSEEPLYLSIRDDKVSFRSARHLMGMTTSDCQHIIKYEMRDENVRIACIGPAGENLSRISCIINERRAIGRKGLGAVMGAKNLKAIAIRGTQEVPIADEEAFQQVRKEMLQQLKESPVAIPVFGKYGTPMVVDHLAGLGILPGKNFAETGSYNPTDKIGIAAQEAIKAGKERCYGCPIGCAQRKMAKTGKFAGVLGEPEFETIFSLGSQVGVEDAGAIAAADRLCDELGFDTISAGVTVGFAIECFKKGLLTLDDTENLALEFGDPDALLAIIKKMAYREGLGALLADGVRAAAKKIGSESNHFAMHVKGLELPGYDVRGAKAHGLNFATAYTGADHCRGYAFQEIFGAPFPFEVDRLSIERKGELTKWNQDFRTVVADCATMCGFFVDMALPTNAVEITAELMTAITGITVGVEDVWAIGERVNNLARAFNVMQGLNRDDDTLPGRLMNEPLPGGASKGALIPREELDGMLDEYYNHRGWDVKTGAPKRERLVQLGLDYVADVMEQAR
jgi:aldehyde:ferredoxin oxidoreductase